MTALAYAAALVILALAGAILLICVRLLYHMERSAAQAQKLIDSCLGLVSKSHAAPSDTAAAMCREVVATIERFAEKSMGDIQLARQHAHERAVSAEQARAAKEAAFQGPGGVFIPAPITGPEDEPGGIPYRIGDA